MEAKKDKSQFLIFHIEEIDKKAFNGTLEKEYSSILEDGRAVGISSYTTNLLAKAAVRQNGKSPEIEEPFLPDSFIYSHLSGKEQNTIKSLELEIQRLKKTPIIKKQRGRTFFLITSILFFLISCFIFIIASDTAFENSELNKSLTVAKDSLNISQETRNSLSDKIEEIKMISFVAGSNKKPTSPSTDNGYVEWLDINVPVKIMSFYTKPSKSGSITISAYNMEHKKVASSTVEVSDSGWQKVELSNFLINAKGKYYLCLEDTSVELAYHGASDAEYALYKNGALKLIGASGKTEAQKDKPSIGTSWYQYFYCIEYRLL